MPLLARNSYFKYCTAVVAGLVEAILLVVGQFEFWWLALQALIPEIMPAEYPSEYASLDQSPSTKVSLIWQVVLYPTA